MDKLSETRQIVPLSLTRKDIRRERFWFFLMLILVLAVVGAVTVALSLYQEIENPSIQRSDSEMINGGKRFIDYFYSLNAATVDRDQFRAISMMMQTQDKEDRLNYLIVNDFVRKTQESRMKSEIDWSKAEASIVEHLENGVLDIEYKAYLVRNDEKAGFLDIILRLVPIDKTDGNTDGVGVWAWKDVSENPFEGES